MVFFSLKKHCNHDTPVAYQMSKRVSVSEVDAMSEKILRTEILATGDEVCSGSVVDSNSAQISERLSGLGMEVFRHSCVGDDVKELVSVLSEIGHRADIAVVTGGIGPTVDDFTAQAAAQAAGVDLQFNPTAAKHIEQFFEKFSKKMAESDIKQAMLPRGAILMPNPVGTAPGFILGIGKCRFYFLPGVPFEMERMLLERVLPDIESFRGDKKAYHLTKMLSVFGLPEAVVNDRLSDLSASYEKIKLGMVARFPVIYVKLTADGENQEELDQRLAAASAWAVKRLEGYVFSREGNSMEAEVAGLLIQRKETLAVAESCTGGLISHLLTNIPGSSGFLLFSGVTYSNRAKMDILGVKEETIKGCGAVSEETVSEMAQGVRRISGAAYGLAVSGIAGPTGSTIDKPLGTVCIGLAASDGVQSRRLQSPFQERLSNKQIFAICALDMLRKKLDFKG